MRDGNVGGTGTIVLKDEFEALVAEFERASEELPPDDDAVRGWQQRASALGRRTRQSDTVGKNKLLLKLQKFRARLRATRIARQRFESDRIGVRPLLGGTTDRPSSSPILGNKHRDPLAAAISAAYVPLELRPGVLPAPPRAPLPNTPTTAEVHQHALPAARPEAPAAVAPGIADAAQELPVAAPPPKLPRPDRRPVVTLPAAVPGSLAIRQDPIVAVVARLGSAGTLAEARSVACNWLRKKKFKLPRDESGDFEIEGTDTGNHAIAVGVPGVWAMQADTVDVTNPARRWRVEMVLVDAQPSPAVSVTLTSIAPADQVAPEPSVPTLVSQLIERVGLLDTESGEALSAEPIVVDGPKQLHHLLASLQSASRRMPVVVLSTYRKLDQPAHLLDPVGLSRRMRGIAKVYVLSREMSWGLTDALSKRFAVAGASVRLFRPGFTPEDDPARHPQWGPDVLHAQNLNLTALSGLLEREAADASLRALKQEDVIPPFDRVRAEVLKRQIEQARKQAAIAATAPNPVAEQSNALQAALDDETKLREMFEEDNHKQQQIIEQLRGELDQVATDREGWRAREYHLESRIKELVQKLREADIDDSVEFPGNWDELENWCRQHLGDRVVVTPKAISAARSSKFENVPYCYEVLLFLAETYVPCRRGVLEGGGARLEEEKLRLGVDISKVGQAADMHRLQDTYSVAYKGGTVPLNMHVSGSSHRDPRKTFRVYFYWDDVGQCVVVGWFPGHLENRMT